MGKRNISIRETDILLSPPPYCNQTSNSSNIGVSHPCMIVRPPIGQPRFSIVVLLPPLSAHDPSRELPRSIRIRTETRADLWFIHLLPSPSGSVVARHWSGINLQSRYFLDKQVARIGGAALVLILSYQNKNKKKTFASAGWIPFGTKPPWVSGYDFCGLWFSWRSFPY